MTKHKTADQEPHLCHVFNVTKNGALTEWEPTTMALALPDGKYALYATHQPANREPEAQAEIDQLRSSLDFYKRRADALQKAQQKMRDPERTIVCDILANGHLLVPDGGRYALPQPVERPPGMAVQALAGEIVDALISDDKAGGYDLKSGLFGPSFYALVRRWAAAEWNSKNTADL